MTYFKKSTAIIYSFLFYFPLACFGCFAPSPSASEYLESKTILIASQKNAATAEKIADYLGVPCKIIKAPKPFGLNFFSDYPEDLTGKQVLVLVTERDPNEIPSDLRLLTLPAKNCSVSGITAVIPYHGCFRNCPRHLPFSGIDIAVLSEMTGVDQIITVDLTGGNIQSFIGRTPVDHLYPSSSFAPYFATKNLSNIVVVPLDNHDADRAQQFSEELARYGIPSDIAYWQEDDNTLRIDGDVTDSDIIVINNTPPSYNFPLNRMNILHESGGRRIFVIVPYPVFDSGILSEIEKASVEEIVITDRFASQESLPPNIRSVSIPPLIDSYQNTRFTHSFP